MSPGLPRRRTDLWRGLRTIKEVVDGRISNSLLSVRSLDSSFPSIKKSLLPLDYTPIATPEAVTLPFMPQFCHLKQNTYQVPEAYTAVVPGMRHCAYENTLLDRHGNIIAESSNTYTQSKQFKWTAYILKKEEHINGCATLLRSASFRPVNDYYHVLIDNLPRLFAIHMQKFEPEQEIKLIAPDNVTPVEAFFLEKLGMRNLRIHVLPSNRIYRYENYIFSSFLTRQFSGYLPKEYLSFFSEKILPHRPGKKDKRVYISRSRAAHRRVTNEEEVLDILGKYGFKAYCFENMPFEEQIEIMYDAESIIAPHGAGLSNILFNRGGKVLELLGVSAMKPHYYYLSKSCGCQYDFLCFSSRNYIHDDFPVNVGRLRQKVESFIEGRKC